MKTTSRPFSRNHKARLRRVLAWSTVGVLCACALATIALTRGNSHQLLYEGTNGRAWLVQLCDQDITVRERAADAVQLFGVRALPEIQGLLHTRDTWLRRQALRLVEAWPQLGLQVFTAEQLQDCGIRACMILGPAAKPATADLLQIFHARPSAATAYALAGTGLEAIPVLEPSLANWNDDIRMWTAFGIGRAAAMAQDPKSKQPQIDFGSTVAALMVALETGDPPTRAAAAWALGNLEERALPAVALLGQTLRDRIAYARSAAASSRSRIIEEPGTEFSAPLPD